MDPFCSQCGNETMLVIWRCDKCVIEWDVKICNKCENIYKLVRKCDKEGCKKNMEIIWPMKGFDDD